MPRNKFKSLGVKWKLRLGENYQNWIVKDCGGNGDCFFASLGTALNIHSNSVRKAVADQITEKNWKTILSTYLIQKNIGQFNEDWDPDNIRSLKDFQDLIKKPKIIWGDHNLICLAQRAFSVNIIPLKRKRGEPSVIYNILDFDKSRNNNIFLDYLSDKEHFRLTGYNNSTIKYCLKNDDISDEMKEIFMDDIGIKI